MSIERKLGELEKERKQSGEKPKERVRNRPKCTYKKSKKTHQ